MKTYPVVLYPKTIRRFLAHNPLPTRQNMDSKAVKPNQQVDVVQKKRWPGFMLLWGLAIASLLFLLCLNSLSPRWLVLFAWALIGWGCCSFGGKQRRQAKAQQPSAPPRKLALDVPQRLFQREQQLRKLLAGKVLAPQGVSGAKQGVSEAPFFAHLKAVFPGVQQGLEFPNPEFNYPYAADFSLVHESGVSLDIEIDEPYVGDSKQPHHALDQGKDDLRNHFFTQHNWIVIRFCEEQVVLYPLSCCQVIAGVLEQVCGDSRFQQQLRGVPDLTAFPMWTARQASRMARQNYRQTYLPRAS